VERLVNAGNFVVCENPNNFSEGRTVQLEKVNRCKRINRVHTGVIGRIAIFFGVMVTALGRFGNLLATKTFKKWQCKHANGKKHGGI
jgi:hypothetical protein